MSLKGDLSSDWNQRANLYQLKLMSNSRLFYSFQVASKWSVQMQYCYFDICKHKLALSEFSFKISIASSLLVMLEIYPL